MVRFLVLIAVVSVVLTVYAVIDCAMTDARRSRALAKPAWLLVIVLVPVIGPLLWVVFGKIRGQTVTRETAPDDDDDFLRSIGISTEVDARSDEERRAESRREAGERDDDAGERPESEDAAAEADGAETGPAPREASPEPGHEERAAGDGSDGEERDGDGRGDGDGDGPRGRSSHGPRGFRGPLGDGPAPHDAAPHLPGDDSQAPRV